MKLLTKSSEAIASASIVLRTSILANQRINAALYTSASEPAAALLLVGSFIAAVLSMYEHHRAKQPSPLLLAYLFISVLFEAVKSRTYWRLPDRTTAQLAAANCAVMAIFFGLEAFNKASLLIAHDERLSKEELSGPISKSFSFWLNDLFRTGYKHVLGPIDLAPVNHSLYSEAISKMFGPLMLDRGSSSRLDCFRPTIGIRIADLTSPQALPLPRLSVSLCSSALSSLR